MLALLLQRRAGYDFRSRCSLVPEGRSPVELVRADGDVQSVEIQLDEALALLGSAIADAQKHDVAWNTETVRLKPMDKLVQLVEASRAIQTEIAPEA